MPAGRLLAALVALGLVAVAVRGRGRLPGAALVALGVAAAALGLVATGVTAQLPDLEHVLGRVAEVLGPWTYALVALMCFLETAAFLGFVAPAEVTVLVGGVVAAQGEVEIVPLLGLAWLSCLLGDTTAFWIGRRLGRPWLVRHGRRLRVTPDRLDRVEGYLTRHGTSTIVAGRFVGVVRPLAPFLTGASGMPYRLFLPYSVVATGLWSATFALLGYVFGRSLGRAAELLGPASVGLALAAAVVFLAVLARRLLRTPEGRRRVTGLLARQARRPALAPATRALAPAGAALAEGWRRARASGLGPESVPLLAVVAVGLYVFGLYAVVLSGGRALTPADQELLDLGDGLRTSWSVEAARWITDLGSFAFVAPLVAVTTGVLLARRRPVEGAFLVASFLLVWLAVDTAKEVIGRPRPDGPLELASKASFPSGHAAQSTTYVALGLVLARVLPGLGSRAALLALALGVAVVVGLSRIYLRVHYWSDVAAGWGLGFAIFAAGALLALVVLRRGGGELDG